MRSLKVAQSCQLCIKTCWHCIICWFCPQPPTSSHDPTQRRPHFSCPRLPVHPHPLFSSPSPMEQCTVDTTLSQVLGSTTTSEKKDSDQNHATTSYHWCQINVKLVKYIWNCVTEIVSIYFLLWKSVSPLFEQLHPAWNVRLLIGVILRLLQNRFLALQQHKKCCFCHML